MTTLIEQLIGKMGLRDEANVLEKTTELVRLLELRATNVPFNVNDYGKIVLCAHLAADCLEIAIDIEQALKLSGLRKTQYVNSKRMFEKLLDLSKIIGVKDICLQLGLDDAVNKAQELLTLYQKVVATENTDIDIQHPQYATMAVFFACKLLKRKVAKTKLMPFSNLRPQQFQQLEQRWEKFIKTHYNDAMENKLQQKQHTQEEHVQKQTAITKNIDVIEEYEQWKQRMLHSAKEKLQAMDNEKHKQKI